MLRRWGLVVYAKGFTRGGEVGEMRVGILHYSSGGKRFGDAVGDLGGPQPPLSGGGLCTSRRVPSFRRCTPRVPRL